MTARPLRVIMPVGDIERAAACCAQVLEQPGRRLSPGRHRFDCGAVILACYDPRADTDGCDARPNPDHVYLAVPDLEAALLRAQAAGRERPGEITPRPWGERSFYARGPFGNPLCFVEAATVFTGR